MTIARGRRRAVHELLERELQPPSTEAAQAVARAEAQAAVAVENARAAVRLAELAEQEDTHERLVKQIERKMNPVRAPCAPPPLAKVTISAPSTCHPRKDTQPPSASPRPSKSYLIYPLPTPFQQQPGLYAGAAPAVPMGA